MQKTASKFDEICQLAIPNQISMHIPNLVKIHWCLLKLSSGNEKGTDGRTYDWRTDGQTHGRPTWNLNTPPLLSGGVYITKTRLFKYIENFTSKNWKFSEKIFDIFLISAQNIDCGYSLEPPRCGGSNEYPQPMFLSRNKKNNVYPCKPQFNYIKVGFKGVKII